MKSYTKITGKSLNNQTAVLLLGSYIDPRNQKRIDLLKQIYDLHVITWDRGNNMPNFSDEEGYTKHVIKINAKNDPLKRLFPYFNFCNRADKLLKEISPVLIDVQGLDMLRIAMNYKKKVSKRIRVIYEVADLHKLLVDKQKNPIRIVAQKYLRSLDINLCKDIDLLIVTSEKYVESYFSDFVEKNKIMIFPNVPNLSAFKNYHKKEHTNPLTIGFIGLIRYKEQIRNLLEAATVCNMNVMLAGIENGSNDIEQFCRNMPNVEWCGSYDFNTQITSLYEKCDIIYSVYDADKANVRVALPNKLYEAIYCELPIIVAKNTYLSEVVGKWGVGIAVDHKSTQELISVLSKFEKDKGMFSLFEENCRKKKEICDLEYYNNQLKYFLCKGEEL